MILPQLPFPIDYDSFNALVSTCANTNGMLSDNQTITIVETSALLPEDIAKINNYYSSLKEEDEAEKIARPALIASKILETKNNLLSMSYHDMSILQRKILMNIQLTDDEIVSLLGT